MLENGPQDHGEKQVERSSDRTTETDDLETEDHGQADREGDRVGGEENPRLEQPSETVQRLRCTKQLSTSGGERDGHRRSGTVAAQRRRVRQARPAGCQVRKHMSITRLPRMILNRTTKQGDENVTLRLRKLCSILR